jgi:hypothetical protein
VLVSMQIQVQVEDDAMGPSLEQTAAALWQNVMEELKGWGKVTISNPTIQLQVPMRSNARV